MSAQIGSKRPQYIEHYMKLSKLMELMATAEEAKEKMRVAGGKSKSKKSESKAKQTWRAIAAEGEKQR